MAKLVNFGDRKQNWCSRKFHAAKYLDFETRIEMRNQKIVETGFMTNKIESFITSLKFHHLRK